jgi:septum site-determining protein MinD
MLAIAGGKGGTGKTTTALALARETAAAESGPSQSLVVDADVDMPDVHALAAVDRTPTVLDRPRGVPTRELDRVRVAPAPPPEATQRFRRVLSNLAGAGAGVFVDAPCGAGHDAVLPLAIADGVVLVTRPTPAAVRDTAKTAAMARTLDTPVMAVAVVGETQSDRLEAALGAPVVAVPRVETDPLASRRHRDGVRRLVATIRGRQTPF